MTAFKKTRGLQVWQIKPGQFGYDCRAFKKGIEVGRKRGTFDGTKDEAIAFYLALKKDLREKGSCSLKLPISSIETFKDILVPYRNNLDFNNELSKSHRFLIDYVERELGDRSLSDFADSLDRYFEVKEPQLWANQKKKYKKKYPETTKEQLDHLPYKPHLRDRFVEICKAAFTFAKGKGKVAFNPITSERFPKRKEVARSVKFDDVTERRLLETIQKKAPYLLPITNFLLMVPCRKRELTRAVWEDLDLEERILLIPKEHSKNKKFIRKHIPVSFLQYFKTLPPAEDYVDGKRYLFYRRLKKNNVCVPLGDFKRMWNACLKLVGIKDLTVRDLRHIAATRMAKRGNSVRVVMDEAGWVTDMLSTYWEENVDPTIPIHGDEKKAKNIIQLPVYAKNTGHQLDTVQSKVG